MGKKKYERKTGETEVRFELDMTEAGTVVVDSGLPFFDHMLHQLFYHAGFSVRLQAKGDLHIDDHHLVEDCGIVIGAALRDQVGRLKEIYRFADGLAPLDESLSRCVIDISGRPHLIFRADFSRAEINGFSTEMTAEFFRALVNHAFITVHLENLYGANDHHKIESLFKVFAITLRRALFGLPLPKQIPSTKGVL